MEIKMRVWDSSQNKMLDHDWLLAANVIYGALSKPRKEITVMMFTGLHDKNGKEIYGGDIVEVTTNNDNVFGADYYLFLVEFVNSGFFYKTNAGLVSLSFNRFTSALVAGNIYEHKHLLQ